MVATTVRKSLLTVLMVFTLLAGLITGFAHTQAAALPHTTSVHTIYAHVAGWCPPPPIVC